MRRCFAMGNRAVANIVLVTLAAVPSAAANYQAPTRVPEEPPNAISAEVRGDLAMARQQYLAAIEAYQDAPRDSAEIWNKLGLAYHHLFAMDQAKRDYQQALRLRPNYPEALNNLGAVYYAKGSFHKAEKYYRRALRLAPQSPSILSNLGTAYFAERKANAGINAYRAAIALDPRIFEDTSPQLISESFPARERAQQDYCLAKLFAQAGQLDRAIDYLRKALNEGFSDRKEILHDQELASLRSTPQFAQLMTEQKLQ